LEFISHSVRTLDKRRDIEAIIDAVVASSGKVLFSNSDSSSVDNGERGPDGDLEASDGESRLDITAVVGRVLLVIGGFLFKGSRAGLPSIVGTRAGLPFGGVVGRDDGDKESKEEDGFHWKGEKMQMFKFIVKILF